jgi:hypothetical protein
MGRLIGLSVWAIRFIPCRRVTVDRLGQRVESQESLSHDGRLCAWGRAAIFHFASRKLIAMLVCSNEVRNAFRKKYNGQESLIRKGNASTLSCPRYDNFGTGSILHLQQS